MTVELPVVLEGRYAKLEHLQQRHFDDLWEATSGGENDELWRYLAVGPFTDRAAFDADFTAKSRSQDPYFLAIVSQATGRALGIASYLRIEPAHRVIEVGHLLFGAQLQRTPAATEAMYLMARYAFESLGYRRYEWKCNARNEPSRRAALRLGFTYEGTFRQHMIVKGQSRDTAWYSMLDGEWPLRKQAFELWLNPANFNAEGLQIKSLSGVRDHLQAGDNTNG